MTKDFLFIFRLRLKKLRQPGNLNVFQMGSKRLVKTLLELSQFSFIQLMPMPLIGNSVLQLGKKTTFVLDFFVAKSVIWRMIRHLILQIIFFSILCILSVQCLKSLINSNIDLHMYLNNTKIYLSGLLMKSAPGWWREKETTVSETTSMDGDGSN